MYYHVPQDDGLRSTFGEWGTADKARFHENNWFTTWLVGQGLATGLLLDFVGICQILQEELYNNRGDKVMSRCAEYHSEAEKECSTFTQSDLIQDGSRPVLEEISSKELHSFMKVASMEEVGGMIREIAELIRMGHARVINCRQLQHQLFRLYLSIYMRM